MKRIIALLILIFINFSCTDLHEEVLDEALGEDLLAGSDIGDGLLAPVYARMHGTMNSGTDYYALQEVSSDEGILPYRGGRDWLDGGKYLELHQHTWTANHGTVQGAWDCFTQGSSRAILAISKLTNTDENRYASSIAEAHAMNAFYMFYLLDMEGLVFKKDPVDFGSDEVTSQVLRTNEAFDYIISELDIAEPALKSWSEVGSGRFSINAAWALKARLYLNKTVYIDPYAPTHTFDPADMDKVIEYCDKLINSGQHSLETSDYFKMFNVDNHNHPEIIYAMDARMEANGSSRLMWMVLSRATYASPLWENKGATGTDGIAITSDFYDTWVGNEDDPRFYKEYLPQEATTVAVKNYTLNRGILRGQQWGIVPNEAGNDFKKDINGDLVIEPLTELREGVPLAYTYEVDLDQNSKQQSGYRASKYQFDPETNNKNNGRVDIPLLRLGDVYLMKAEALLRKGQNAAAMAVVNELRDARGAKPITILDLDIMLNERGYEMYAEQIRRTDQIRFDKFEDIWTSKTNDDVSKRLFPIPQSAINANPELLHQNKGY